MISLQHKHSFGLQSFARSYQKIMHQAQIPESFAFDEPYWLLGEGSNTVFVQNFSGVVVHMQTKGVQIYSRQNEVLAEVQAGENWHNLVVQLLNKGVFGLENLALIPGSVGAAPVQNIGAYGAEFAQFCERVRCFDPQSRQWLELTRQECRFGYRDSIFKQAGYQHFIIASVTLKFPKRWQANVQYNGLEELTAQCTARDVFERVVSIRKNKLPDPAILGNAGSFFKNPVITTDLAQQIQCDYPQIPVYTVNEQHAKVPAAYLIDQCGLKGHRWGQIAAHANQPLVLVNLGGASGEQLLYAARTIREKVQQRFNITLQNEVRLIGAEGEVSL